VDLDPSTALPAVNPLFKKLREVVGQINPLHVLSKLMGAVAFTTDVSPANPGKQTQSEMENDPFSV
jgi:hypothetical protein